MTMQDYRDWAETQNTKKPYLSVVIPTYNEEWRILPTIGAIASFVSSLDFAWELIISDDGSTDDTIELVENLNLVNMQLLKSENTGKGGAVKRGVLKAQGDLVLFLDADQATPIEQLPELIDAITKEKADIVIGSRSSSDSTVANKSFFRKTLSWGLKTLVKIGFRLPHKDTQCGFKLFSAESAKRLFNVAKIDGFSFDLELLYIAKKTNMKVAEVGVSWHDAPGSTVSGTQDTIKFIKDMPKILSNSFKGEYKIEKENQTLDKELTKV